MAAKKKNYIAVLLIFVLAFLAGNFVYPQLLNIPYFQDKDFKLGLDLQGGTHLIYGADLTNIASAERGQAMEGLRDVMERRVNFFGVSEPVVQIQKEKLIIELAGIIDPGEAIKQIGQTPFLEFKEQKENFNEIIEKNNKVEETKEGELEDPFQSTALTGRYLQKAEVTFDQTTYQPLISLQFNEEGAKLFEEITGRNVGKPLPIYIDNLPISAPTVQEKISGGKAQITGSFTPEEAKALARNLNAGALPVPITLISQQSVGPTLGKLSLDKSLQAGLWGFLSVIVFMILFYRVPGFLAASALVIYLIFILALFKLIPVTLTLAGIAGVILSIGMAVDANVLIFSRMREELRAGKAFSQAVEDGFSRAWPAIRDGNLTTLLVAFVLFGFGSSFIKGFATTLSLGVLMSMLSAVIITKNFLRLFSGTRAEKLKWIW
ncbi:MAG: protein translocase subunit SecD [Candidatus Nealsonbacteria bacterium]|nr:protein translocase subunit SecD [Candidatus Nealsonbacteria bacterium]